MQAAKKLVLVDEFDREYKNLQRPADKVAKTDQSLQLSDTLRDQSIADDRKVREYVTALHTYLNVRNEVPAESEVQPILGTYTPPALYEAEIQKVLKSDDERFASTLTA